MHNIAMEFNDNFEWDDDKYEKNLKKHQLNFNEAKTIWLRPHDLAIRQDTRVTTEVRYIAYGLLASGRLIVVVYTQRDEKIRIISARRANMRERNSYEKIHRPKR